MRCVGNVSGGWTQSVKWICVIGLMILLPSVGSASDEKPERIKSLDPIEELFYLDRIDDLTTQRDYWMRRYELDIEEAPVVDEGFPWLEVVVAAAAGYVIKDLID